MYIDVIHKALILNNAESIAKKEGFHFLNFFFFLIKFNNYCFFIIIGSGIFDMLIHDKIEELVHCY